MSLVETIRREANFLGTTLRLGGSMLKLLTKQVETVPDLVEQWAERTPGAVAIRFEGREVTYREYDEQANRYAAWARGLGVQRGDVVAILMENRPEFLFAWLGLAKIGAVSALINTNLLGGPLAHCLRVSEATYLVLGGELVAAYAGARELLEHHPKV